MLGDVVLSGIYERRMSAMSAQAIIDWHASAVDEWEGTLLAQLGAAVLSSRRTKDEFEQQQNIEAARRLVAMPQAVAELEDNLASLRDAESFVERLDVNAYYADTAPRLGVQAEYMPLPNAPANVEPLQLPDERNPSKGFKAFFDVDPTEDVPAKESTQAQPQ